MIVLAIDPGNEQSAYALYDSGWPMPLGYGKVANETMLSLVSERGFRIASHVEIDLLAIEMIASYGMPVGAEVFETVFWSGRFAEAWGGDFAKVYRRDVKLHLCGQPRAKDGNVRQALIDRWGGKEKAIGTKKAPGPLYGFKADVWQALAVAVTWSDKHAMDAKPGTQNTVSAVQQ